MQPIEQQIVDKLLNDTNFGFKDFGKYLQKGTCPSCSKNEVFVAKEKPYVVKCNRLNQCQYEENTRDIYSELFESLSELYPVTEDNRQATADAYMKINRQFPIDKIRNWYSQESYRLPGTDIYVDTVRFYIDDKNERYWERLIDKSKSDGQRHNIAGKRKTYASHSKYFKDYNGSLYKGEWWKPRDQVFNRNDRVFLVEGIFHALSLYFKGFKSVATIAANNFPSLSIEKHLGKGITWCLALDDDKAGRDAMKKHAKKLKSLGESIEFVLTGNTKLDWDDLYRLGKLNDKFIDDALYRGRLFGASSVQVKAYHWYCRQWRPTTVLDFNERYFSIKVDEELTKDLSAMVQEETDKAPFDLDEALLTEQGEQLFQSHLTIQPITNCRPEFLYCEQNQITQEIAYFFNVGFPVMPERKISITGSALESPAAFNKALLNQAPGANFDGNSPQFKTLRDRWFNKKILIVDTIPYLGYDKASDAYIFNDWGYRQGRFLKQNAQGYFEAGKQQVKSSFKSFAIHRASAKFDPSWLSDFSKVFAANGMMALAYWLGSLFANQIRAELKAFPFLELTGEHGAGKSTLIEFLWKLIGRDDYEGFDPSKATFAARTRAFSQLSNMPVVLIESDRVDDKAKKGAFDFEELKTAYNGRAVRSMGAFNRGNDIEEPPFNGTIVIAQNAEVDGTPALLSRIVHGHCTKAHFSAETKPLALKFERAQLDDVAGFLPVALSKEREILDHFTKLYPTLDEQLAKMGTVKDGRIIKTHAMLAALASCLKFVFPQFNSAWEKRLTDFIFERAETRQQRMNADHPLVQQFWEQYDFLNIRSDKPNGGYFAKPQLNHSGNDKVIAINLNHFYQVCRDSNLEAIPTADLKKLLAGSQRHKYLGNKAVKSVIKEQTVYCWTFSAGANGSRSPPG